MKSNFLKVKAKPIPEPQRQAEPVAVVEALTQEDEIILTEVEKAE